MAVRCRGRAFKWDTVIEQKTAELGSFLVSRVRKLDFSEPSPGLIKDDSRELPRRILSLSQPEAHKLGIGKGTFHYLRARARSQRPLRAYKKVTCKLAD